MISLRALLLRTHKITIKFARQNLPRVFHSLPGGQADLTEKITCQSCGLSKIPHSRFNFIGIQSVSCSGMDSNAVEFKASKESESDLPKNHAPNMQVEMSTGEGCGQTGPRAKTHIDSETSQPEKRDRKKPKKARVRGRKQKLKSSECASSLLQELPFTNTIVWKDLGFETSEKAVKKKRKRGDSGRGESEEDGDKKKKRQPRPNYFVSIPITNPKIRDGIQAVQDLLVEKDKRYSKALIPVGSLHITLLVTYLSDEEEVDAARGVMAQMEQTVRDLLQGKDLVLPFLGIGNFRNEVAFVQLAEGAHVTVLTEIAEVVRKMFEEKGVSSRDGRAFKPHLTFVKLSKAPKLRSQGLKKIDPEAYESFLEHSFGEETVSRLDLCSMLKKKTPDGYFHCETSITFDLIQGTPRSARTSEKKGAEPDDEELLSLSKRLVEDAVLRAVQQYMEETQRNADTPGDQGSAKPGQNLNASGSK